MQTQQIVPTRQSASRMKLINASTPETLNRIRMLLPSSNRTHAGKRTHVKLMAPRMIAAAEYPAQYGVTNEKMRAIPRSVPGIVGRYGSYGQQMGLYIYATPRVCENTMHDSRDVKKLARF